jgi:hypothetical protein
LEVSTVFFERYRLSPVNPDIPPCRLSECPSLEASCKQAFSVPMQGNRSQGDFGIVERSSIAKKSATATQTASSAGTPIRVKEHCETSLAGCRSNPGADWLRLLSGDVIL